MSEALFSMVAGSDTTASAIRATILYLITNPRVYHKFKQVVREAVQDGHVSSPIKQEEAKQIPYLQVRDPKCTYPPRRQEDHQLISARP
jgi:cytochrome P450